MALGKSSVLAQVLMKYGIYFIYKYPLIREDLSLTSPKPNLSNLIIKWLMEFVQICTSAQSDDRETQKLHLIVKVN